MNTNDNSYFGYLQLGRRFKTLLKAERYQDAFEFLGSDRTKHLTTQDKLILNGVFDEFLERLDQDNEHKNSLSPDNIQILSGLKKILILMELELSGYDRRRLKKLLRRHIRNERPLGALLKQPFVIIFDFANPGRNQIPAEDIALMYREVLGEMAPAQARYLHSRQMLYYQSLPSEDIFRRFSLRKLGEIELISPRLKTDHHAPVYS